MNTKISVFLVAILISCSSIFYSCNNAEKAKAEGDATEMVEDAKTEVKEVNQEFVKERQDLKMEWNTKIEALDARLAQVDAKLETQGNKATNELKERREAFGKEYADFKSKLNQTENQSEDEWQKFKEEIKAQSDKADQEVNYFFAQLGM